MQSRAESVNPQYMMAFSALIRVQMIIRRRAKSRHAQHVLAFSSATETALIKVQIAQIHRAQPHAELAAVFQHSFSHMRHPGQGADCKNVPSTSDTTVIRVQVVHTHRAESRHIHVAAFSSNLRKR